MPKHVDGNIDSVVDLPCSLPTSCTFGGENLDTLDVTSARFTMGPTHLAKNPCEGRLFSLSPGVKGLPSHRFGMTGWAAAQLVSVRLVKFSKTMFRKKNNVARPAPQI